MRSFQCEMHSARFLFFAGALVIPLGAAAEISSLSDIFKNYTGKSYDQASSNVLVRVQGEP